MDSFAHDFKMWPIIYWECITVRSVSHTFSHLIVDSQKVQGYFTYRLFDMFRFDTNLAQCVKSDNGPYRKANTWSKTESSKVGLVQELIDIYLWD